LSWHADLPVIGSSSDRPELIRALCFTKAHLQPWMSCRVRGSSRSQLKDRLKVCRGSVKQLEHSPDDRPIGNWWSEQECQQSLVWSVDLCSARSYRCLIKRTGDGDRQCGLVARCGWLPTKLITGELQCRPLQELSSEAIIVMSLCFVTLVSRIVRCAGHGAMTSLKLKLLELS